MVMPGDTMKVSVKLVQTPSRWRLDNVLRSARANKTVGAGKVLKIDA